MPPRLQEIHPSLVHFPIALLPTSLAADALGLLTDSDTLQSMGRTLMPIAAGAAALAGVTGLIAQESVVGNEEAQRLLVTHRTLNIGLVGLAAGLAIARVQSKSAGPAYLAVGAAGVAAMVYSAYLGGKMVYEHGLGVAAAGGLSEPKSPEMTFRNAPRTAALAAQELVDAVRHAVEDFADGQVVPVFRRGGA